MEPIHISLARTSAHYALRATDLTPSSIYAKISPGRVGDTVLNNELRGPSLHLRHNTAYHSLVDFWSIHSMSGVRLWLQIAATIKGKGKFPLHLLLSWQAFHIIMENAFPYINLSELEIPIFRSYGNTSKFRMVTLGEYCQIYPFRTPHDFFCDIVEIVLYGFIVDMEHIKALRLQDDYSIYITQSLAGGEYYPLVSSLFQVSQTPMKRGGMTQPDHLAKRTRY